MDHVKVISGVAYCPRHAGVMKAILKSATPEQRPAVDCRAPSLAAWMAEALDAEISNLLHGLGETAAQAAVVKHGLRHHVDELSAHNHWEYRWELVRLSGETLQIAVVVKEEMDIVVGVHIGDKLLTRVVPPWIELHQLRETVEDEGKMRDQFFGRLLFLLAQTVEMGPQVLTPSGSRAPGALESSGGAFAQD